MRSPRKRNTHYINNSAQIIFNQRNKIMGMVKFLLIIISLLFMGCTTLPKADKINKNKRNIHTIAILPLKLYKKGSYGKEVMSFKNYWENYFYDEFEKNITLVNSIKVKYPGIDYDTKDLNNLDYDSILKKLNVDALMEIELTKYNEVSKAGRGAQLIGAFFTMLIFGAGTIEKMVAAYNIHTYYMGIEDYQMNYYIELGGIKSNIEQRKLFMEKLLEWLDKNYPLSIRYKEKA